MNVSPLTRSVAALVVAATFVVTPALAGAGGATVPAVPGSAATAAPLSCPEVVVLAVDGHGNGWDDGPAAGTSLYVLTSSLVGQATRAGSSVAVRHLGVPFADADALAPGDQAGRSATKAVTKSRTRSWFQGKKTAITGLTSELMTLSAACPEQAYVLAGDSQGAGAVHRFLLKLDGNTALQGRLVGAVLVADGDRVAGTGATILGAPAAAASGRGVVATYLGSVADVPTSTLDVPVASVCTQGDIVCDLRNWSVTRSLAAHETYRTKEGRRQLHAAAKQMWDRASAWPRPLTGQTVATTPGESFSRQLLVRVGSAHAATSVFEPLGALPAGVTLSESGVLAGAVSTAGSVDVSFAVHNSAPVTSSTSGTVTIVATSVEASSQVNAGGQSSCHVNGEGTAYCQGDNTFGQLGDGTDVDRRRPVQVGAIGEWATISTSGATTCGVKRTGQLFCWGMNARGQLGLGGGPQRWSPQLVGTSSSWATVATGWLHTCGVRQNGTLWCWGANDAGELGIGSRISKAAPVKVGEGKSWTSVTVGGWHSCGLHADGSASCWGRNDFGQLGTGSTARRLRPIAVASDLSWTQLDASWSSTCGLATDGVIRCWGQNDQGQLGDGSRVPRLLPVDVAGARAWSDLAVGDTHACGLDSTGTAWCWGSNRYGELGDGTETGSPTPTKVAGDQIWVSLDAGWLHSCALALDDTMQCWGNNEKGQLGRGDRINRSTPPGVRPPAQRVVTKRLAKNVVVTTFNVLGSSHTQPGGGAMTYAPGRIRAEWTANFLQAAKSGILAFQELKTDQAQALERALGDTYSFYPGSRGAPRVVWQSIMWDSSQWELVEAEDIWVPVIGTTRPNPFVLLRNRGTGREVGVLNVHNSSKNTPERQRERNQAVRLEIKEILKRRHQGIPVLFLGDMNEREKVFCKVTGQTDLEAVTGGSNTGKCRPPGTMHFDWMFASPEFKVRSRAFVRTPQIVRITDHAVLTSTMSVPGA
ncbi:MAG: cutinase family protein [Nocardioides sp.]|nr:cutinase family protein [Nocardioides sp.]